MEIAVMQKNICWQAGNDAVVAAVRHAESIGVKVNVAVVDQGGHLAASLRMPGAPFHSIDIAKDKAYTAVSFGFSTADWSTVLDSFSQAVKDGLLGVDRMMMFGGGLPIIVEDMVIGAIGVSGASEEEDAECAAAGLAAIGLK
ncbi:MAG TPA: heme-binding protein [Thiotrichaceae bacterium]|nr:heme-binding protein [Thiotrichaceae bacterium]HIM08001.1 heme-binding protein [Gammaproteobacteria bacterium]